MSSKCSFENIEIVNIRLCKVNRYEGDIEEDVWFGDLQEVGTGKLLVCGRLDRILEHLKNGTYRGDGIKIIL